MLTKFILHTNGGSYELRDNDLKNWDEVRCAYKRADYDGIVRSFTSQFEFVNQAYDFLQEIFLRDRYNAVASIEVQTIDDRWIYHTQFTCPLDFSTISWDSYVLSINAVDNSLAALIKANKSTKFEFEIGTDIISDRTLKLSRIPMKESLVYGFTQGESADDSEEILVDFKQKEHPWVGNKGSEISINQTLDWMDDQKTDLSSYILKVEKDVIVAFSFNYIYRSNKSYGGPIIFSLKTIRNGEVISLCDCGSLQPLSSSSAHYFGSYKTESELPDLSEPYWSDETQSQDWRYNGFGVVDGIVWYCQYRGSWIWVSSNKTVDEYFLKDLSGKVELRLQSGDVVYLEHTISGPFDKSSIRFVKSELLFEWMATGEDVYIEVTKPAKLCEAILNRIIEPNIKIHVVISNFDNRIANTYLMAAENIRAIPGAKFYTSFNEFCDWMSTVFGYVYYIGNQINKDNRIEQTIYFVHRSELFKNEVSPKIFKHCRDLKFGVDSKSIYSTITVGYDKKDYENVNGRDEFNFNITYSTGLTVTDKTLSLLSKYRADCYGIEFAIQKRAQNTTDTKSDKDVFFVLCQEKNELLIVDRTIEIKNCSSELVFNGAFSPIACVKANAGYIGLQGNVVELRFASSTGNSSTIIDGVPMSGNITIKSPIATCEYVEFTTDIVDMAENYENDLYELENEGVVYRGFMKEAEFKYAREESAKYKLIIKEIKI